MASTLKETLDRMMQSLPRGGSINLEVRFDNCPPSAAKESVKMEKEKVKKERKKRSAKSSRRRSRSSSVPPSDDSDAIKTVNSCDEEDAYSFDTDTERIFPKARLVRGSKSKTSSSGGNSISSKKKTRRTGDKQKRKRAHRGLKSLSSGAGGGRSTISTTKKYECDSDGAYSVDLKTNSIFPPAAMLSASSKSIFSSDGSTYGL